MTDVKMDVRTVFHRLADESLMRLRQGMLDQAQAASTLSKIVTAAGPENLFDGPAAAALTARLSQLVLQYQDDAIRDPATRAIFDLLNAALEGRKPAG